MLEPTLPPVAVPAPLLQVHHLYVGFGGQDVVKDLSFCIQAGEKLALVGESGSGKTITALSLLRLVGEAQLRGEALMGGRNLLQISEREMQAVRGDEIAVIFQEPMTALNPLMTMGAQIAEVLQLKQGLSYETLAGVQRGALDCAYVLSDNERIDGLELVRLSAVDLVVTLPQSVADAQPELSLEQLTEMPWVGTPPSCILRVHLEKLFAGAGREYRPGRTADGESAIRSMVASGMGAGLLRSDYAEQGERNGELAIWKGWRSHTWLCWVAPEGSERPVAVEAVRGAVMEAWA